VIPEPVLDGRRVERLVQELRRFAPHYTPDLNLTDEQSVGAALMRIFAQLAEAVLVRLDRTPQKHFVAFLDRLGISLLPARPAIAPITFRLASGLTESVSVPHGTRVAAAGPEDDIPFETSGELLAIPSALVAAYGVDPNADVIYAPPPGFLKQEIRTPTELVYTVQAFTATGATRLQLDHATDLQPGSFLRIACREKVVIAKILDGNIVSLEAPLARDVAAQSLVTPIRDFEVFDGIDRQEHVLYIGDADLFTVKKEEAKITLTFTMNESAVALAPLNITWQFWTKDDTAGPDAEEHWETLDVAADGTQGLSRSGQLQLVKPATLEIKEREVGGRKSRWIRGQLQDKLPAGARALPEVDTLTVIVASGPPGGIPADQGFHNATPLDVQVQAGFFPFGTEPRQFDQFYIASKEAFSKREANVTLKLALDLQTIATPSLVPTSAGLRAYAIGLRRRLYELPVQTGGTWRTIGTPDDSTYIPPEDAVPSAIVDVLGSQIYVFVTTLDSAVAQNPPSKIWVHSHQSGLQTGTWTDLDTPPDAGTVASHPAAVRLPIGSKAFARVFVIGGDGKLYSRDITATVATDGDWRRFDSPTGQLWKPTLSVHSSGNQVFVFVIDLDGIVTRLALDPTGADAPSWTVLKPNNQTFEAVSRPFAQPLSAGSADHRVFVFGVERATDPTNNKWKLFECDTSAEVTGECPWEDLGNPAQNTGIREHPDAHAPAGFIEAPTEAIGAERKHIFLRGSDNRLYERSDNAWVDRTRPGDPSLRDSPAVDVTALATSTGTFSRVSVLAPSGRNSVVLQQFDIVRATVTGARKRAALLNQALASSQDNAYTNKNLDVRPAGPNHEIVFVQAYDGLHKLARVTPAFTVVPDSSSPCVIDAQPIGNARDDAEDWLIFHPPVPDTTDATVLEFLVDDVETDTKTYSRRTGMIEMDPTDATDGDPFVLYLKITGVPAEFLAIDDSGTPPELSWEYWNGTGWVSLLVNDGTGSFLKSGDITFTVPTTIQPTEVVGQENFWIRARLVGGDYGRETFFVKDDKVISDKSSLHPPKVSTLRIVYVGKPLPPGICLTFNNLDYLDQTAASQLGGARFRPFDGLERFAGRSVSLFLGFDRAFRLGPVRLLIDAAERDYDETSPPEFDWRFRRDRLWKPLDADDESVALTRQGILTLVASEELTRELRFGQPLFWIRGSLRTDRGGASYPNPLLRGIFLNTVRAVQGETIAFEIVGSSDGEPNQAFQMQHADVLEGEDIRVRETLSAEEEAQIVHEQGRDAVVVRDDLTGTWVRWRETEALFDSGPLDRCYLLDRASGVVHFGDGDHGRIPPADVDGIRAFSYRTGGGSAGNVPAGKIDSLVTAVAGIEAVFNPTPAGGGSDKATTEAMLTIGPRRISHRDRAVSAEDFEELAQEASRQVAKVKCLTTTNLVRRGTGKPDPCDRSQRHDARPAPGFVSLIIVPDAPDAQPCPSLELRRAVREYLEQRAPSVLAGGGRIIIRPPDYVEVVVEAEIFVTTLEDASDAEKRGRAALELLLHPLRGGTDGRGWEFGRPVWKSDVFSVLERIDTVDRVENLRFHFRGRTDVEGVVIGPNELLASGQHLLAIKRA
jgi:hypothetical protein